jgi:hypothetical protein
MADDDVPVTGTYVRVLAFEAVVLLALWAAGRWFQ